MELLDVIFGELGFSEFHTTRLTRTVTRRTSVILCSCYQQLKSKKIWTNFVYPSNNVRTCGLSTISNSLRIYNTSRARALPRMSSPRIKSRENVTPPPPPIILWVLARTRAHDSVSCTLTLNAVYDARTAVLRSRARAYRLVQLWKIIATRRVSVKS